MYSQEDGNEIIQIANVGPGSPKAELILPQGQVDVYKRQVFLRKNYDFR